MGWRAHSDAAGFAVSSFSRVDGHRVDRSSGLINMSVSLNLLPVVGVPLPFISIGGSALVSALLAVGLLLACAAPSLMPDEVLRPRNALNRPE